MMTATLSNSTQSHSLYFPMQVDLSLDLSGRYIFAKHGGWTHLTFLITLRAYETICFVNQETTQPDHTHSQFSSDVVDSLLDVLLGFFRVLFHEDGPDHLVDSGALVKAIKHLEINSMQVVTIKHFQQLIFIY